jgi:hypothetical protein
MTTENDWNRAGAGWTVIRGADSNLFQGILMYATWGQLESAPKTYNWSLLHNVLNALPAGKKLGLIMSWQSWHGAIPCPADMVGNPQYDGGYVGTGTLYSTYYYTPTMDRYLTFMKDLAKEFDADPRLAYITIGELANQTYKKGPSYNAATTLANVRRLTEITGYFEQTVFLMNSGWWPYGGTGEPNSIIDQTRILGGGWGGPDMHVGVTSFSAYQTAHAGKMAGFQGMEWEDLLAFSAEPFPQKNLETAIRQKTNFIHWNPNNRASEGGHNFYTEVLSYLRENPLGGITTACPENMVCAGTTGTNDVSKTKLDLYPNPAKDLLQINFSLGNATILIFNIYGNIVFQKKGVNNSISVNMNGLPSGIYIVRLENSKNALTGKFIKG